MRVAYHSREGSSISWCRRLMDEGSEVLLYIPPTKEGKHTNKRIGSGIVPKAQSFDDWMRWGAQDPNTVYFFDCSDCGEIADKLKRFGKRVVGGGSFMDKLENDREYGIKFAEACGVQQPPHSKFSTISAAMAYIERNPPQHVGDGGWAWKPFRDLGSDTSFCGDPAEVLRFLGSAQKRFGDNVAAIVQERVKGVALSTARWWNGMRFVGPYEATLEHKKLMDGDIGPATGCSLNLVWFYRDRYPKVAKMLQWERVEQQFRTKDAPAGLYDINAIVSRSGAWFLEWTPRLGIDSELTSQRGISSLSQLLWRLTTGEAVDDLFDTDQVYGAVRLSVPPYPNEMEGDTRALGVAIAGADGIWARTFVGVGIERTGDGLSCADTMGYIGCAVAADTSVEGCFETIYDYLDDKLKVANLQYRTDACEVICKDIEAMAKVGYDTTPILDGEVEYA